MHNIVFDKMFKPIDVISLGVTIYAFAVEESEVEQDSIPFSKPYLIFKDTKVELASSSDEEFAKDISLVITGLKTSITDIFIFFFKDLRGVFIDKPDTLSERTGSVISGLLEGIRDLQEEASKETVVKQKESRVRRTSKKTR